MTCRELIVYILANGLEDKTIEELAANPTEMFGLISEVEVATKFGVDIPTVRIWHSIGLMNGVEFRGALFFPKSVIDPRKKERYE